MAHQAGAYPGFRSIRRLGVFLLPTGWDAIVHRRVPPSIRFAGAHLYTWVERGTVSEVSCPRTQHNVPVRAQTPTTRSGIERNDHEATAPLSKENTRELKKPRRRRQGQLRLNDEFIFYLRISRYPKVIYFVYHYQNYHETESRTHQ